MKAGTLSAVPGYDEIVDRNSITILKTPGDLVLKDGDIAVSRRGDLLLNDHDYHATFRLVQQWRYNVPTLKVLWSASFAPTDASGAVEASFPKPTYAAPHPLFSMDYEAYHHAIDREGAEEVARGVYSGTIMVLLSKVMLAYQSDIGATEAEWNTAGPLVKGYSVGRIIAVSANNVRHSDEWVVTRPPTPVQLKSLQVLADVLGEPLSQHRHHNLSREVSLETLPLISGGSFEGLEKSVFQFANAMLDLRLKRKPCQ